MSDIAATMKMVSAAFDQATFGLNQAMASMAYLSAPGLFDKPPKAAAKKLSRPREERFPEECFFCGHDPCVHKRQPEMRAEALEVVSCSSPPGDPCEHDTWYNTADGNLYAYVNGSWERVL